jgi:hypothetical protein
MVEAAAAAAEAEGDKWNFIISDLAYLFFKS